MSWTASRLRTTLSSAMEEAQLRVDLVEDFRKRLVEERVKPVPMAWLCEQMALRLCDIAEPLIPSTATDLRRAQRLQARCLELPRELLAEWIAAHGVNSL